MIQECKNHSKVYLNGRGRAGRQIQINLLENITKARKTFKINKLKKKNLEDEHESSIIQLIGEIRESW